MNSGKKTCFRLLKTRTLDLQLRKSLVWLPRAGRTCWESTGICCGVLALRLGSLLLALPRDNQLTGTMVWPSTALLMFFCKWRHLLKMKRKTKRNQWLQSQMLAPGKLRIDNNSVNGNKLNNLSQSNFSFLSVRAVVCNHCSSMYVHSLKERWTDPPLSFIYVNLSFVIILILLRRTPEELIKYHWKTWRQQL